MRIQPKFVVENRIFEMFRGGGGGSSSPNVDPNNPAPNANQNPGAPTPGNIPDPNNPQNRTDPNANPNVPADQRNKSGEDKNKSPLDEFTGLWDDPPAPKPGEEQTPNWDDHGSLVPRMKIDPQKLIASARKIDFSKALNPERVMKALKEGDVGAFNEVMNSALQAAFANQAMTMSRMAETMFSQFSEKLYTGALPHHFRKHQVSNQIDADNPIFSNPAVAPMLESVKQQFQVKYPKATPKEISDMAKKYVLTFADAVKGGDAGASSGGAGKGGKGGGKPNEDNMDWLEFAGGPQQ